MSGGRDADEGFYRHNGRVATTATVIPASRLHGHHDIDRRHLGLHLVGLRQFDDLGAGRDVVTEIQVEQDDVHRKVRVPHQFTEPGDGDRHVQVVRLGLG